MDVRLSEVADGVLAAITAGEFSRSFTAQRAWAPSYSLEDLATLRVTVRPAGFADAMETRGSARRDFQIEVGVQERLGDTDTEAADTDAHALLVEEIADWLRGKAPGEAAAAWTGTESVATAVREQLDELRALTSVLRLTYRAVG